MKTLDDTLAAITAGACAGIEWAHHASVCMIYPSGLVSLGATDPLVLKAEAAQGELQEGPILTVGPAIPLVHSDDVVRDPRWPRYARFAAELGVRAQTGVLVAAGEDRRVVLNLYSRSEHRLSEPAADAARIFADQAATAIDCAFKVETLTGALEGRQEISMAIGIVMERFGLNETRAFEYLVRVSQTSQVKLRLIAQELVGEANVKDATV